jgi:hypothetical protein
VIGHKFSLGAAKDGQVVGVVIVGRPVSRVRDDGLTLEVTRRRASYCGKWRVSRPPERPNGKVVSRLRTSG